MSEHQHVEEDDIEREELGQFLNRLNFKLFRMFQRSKGWIPGLLSKPKNPHSLEHLKWVTDIWSISIVGIIKYRDVVCTSLIIIFDITKLQNVVTFICVFHHLTPLNFSPALCILWIHEICVFVYLKISLMSDVQYMYVCQHAIILIPTKSISHVVNHQHSKYQTNSFQFNLTLMR